MTRVRARQIILSLRDSPGELIPLAIALAWGNLHGILLNQICLSCGDGGEEKKKESKVNCFACAECMTLARNR